LIFTTEPEKFGDQVSDVPVGMAHRSFVADITSFLSNWMFNEEGSNISNQSWMKSIDNHFLIFTGLGDMGEKAPETIWELWSQKKQTSILSCCKFW
jgi:hypothetical protein